MPTINIAILSPLTAPVDKSLLTKETRNIIAPKTVNKHDIRENNPLISFILITPFSCYVYIFSLRALIVCMIPAFVFILLIVGIPINSISLR